MNQCKDLLFELGTEELPPVALRRLSAALTEEFVAGLEKAGLTHAEVTSFATPRRLAVLVKDCAEKQPDREGERRGPALQASFDAQGNPSKAAQGFARSCGTSVDKLERIKTDKGEWLGFRLHEPGKPAMELLPGIAEHALNRLPIPKRMRWGQSEAQFVRPVHWLLFLHGTDVVPCRLLDAEAGPFTRGHRFHHPDQIEITEPKLYAEILEHTGIVIAHFDIRREHIRRQVENTADTLGGRAEIDENLLDEVTALVEWPQPIAAGFEEEFLEVPHEALILTMKKNQKYFHLVDANQHLMNHFITIANIDSPTPEVIKEGNERVVRPRLSDAKFFWEQDGRQSLESRIDSLKSVVFQQKLGSMYDKSERVSRLAGVIAARVGGDAELARRAGMLSRCDLMTEMVGEFPEMQGIMGRYQAQRDGESEELAQAMEEFYLPRFSGDRLPQSPAGIAISLAEKLDTLVGIFSIGQKPTGDKDPFALRRAALGALRIMREHAMPIGLKELLQEAGGGLQQGGGGSVDEVYPFMLERLKGIYLELGFSVNTFESVAEVNPGSVADFDRRMQAVVAFEKLPDAEALAAANKRIRNILRKTDETIPEAPDPSLFQGSEETALHRSVEEKSTEIRPLLAAFDYAGVLVSLAQLRQPVDRFFDQVMVMADDQAIRRNRLALLMRLNQLFLGVADISRLH
jgi:glycyl-tRNA synthetase beta chain